MNQFKVKLFLINSYILIILSIYLYLIGNNNDFFIFFSGFLLGSILFLSQNLFFLPAIVVGFFFNLELIVFSILFYLILGIFFYISKNKTVLSKERIDKINSQPYFNFFGFLIVGRIPSYEICKISKAARKFLPFLISSFLYSLFISWITVGVGVTLNKVILFNSSYLEFILYLVSLIIILSLKRNK